MKRIGLKRRLDHGPPSLSQMGIIVLQFLKCCICKEPEVYRSKYLSHHSCLLLHKLSSSICIVDKFIIWDTAYFCLPVGANFVLGSCSCTETNVLDSKRKPFYKHKATQANLPTVMWLFSILDHMRTFASQGYQARHSCGHIASLLPPLSRSCLGINHCELQCGNIYNHIESSTMHFL